jgi:hypothetical protein
MEPKTERPEVRVNVGLVEDEGRATADDFSFSRFGPVPHQVSIEEVALAEIRMWAREGIKIFKAAEGFKTRTVIPWHMVREITLESRGPKA